MEDEVPETLEEIEETLLDVETVSRLLDLQRKAYLERIVVLEMTLKEWRKAHPRILDELQLLFPTFTKIWKQLRRLLATEIRGIK